MRNYAKHTISSAVRSFHLFHKKRMCKLGIHSIKWKTSDTMPLADEGHCEICKKNFISIAGTHI